MSFFTKGTSPKFSIIIPSTPAVYKFSTSFWASLVISSNPKEFDGEPGKAFK